MAEEFEESEVVFQDNVKEEEDRNQVDGFVSNSWESWKNKTKRKKLKDKTGKNSAAPRRIPESAPSRNPFRVDPDWDGDDGEMVPPHVIVGRRVAREMMAFSVCTGNGRTLKGRDLSHVRNSILRMTGFLET